MLLLVDTYIHLQDSARHVYVEVVLHGETEGKFHEDPDAHRDETVGQVSRLGAFWRDMGEREADDFPCRYF